VTVTTATVPINAELRLLWEQRAELAGPRPTQRGRRVRQLLPLLMIYAGLFMTGFGSVATYRLMP
jgi:hypothetical protein